MTNYLKMLNIFEKNMVIIHKIIENHGSKHPLFDLPDDT